MFGLAHSLLDQENHKTGWHKGHGKNDTDGNQDVYRCGHPEQEHKPYVTDNSTENINA